ncbi:MULTISPECIES: hypothetical protein [unclassified Microcoleus]|uniref:hypothetical protein n=1 Tax=unclassified Microcoleus TaxID=2642155 RepID=UPI0025EC59B9|nr:MULTISPECIES: hypothetical protein [unclassified Microcoleus]
MLKVRTALCFSLLSVLGSPAVLASNPVVNSSQNTASVITINASGDVTSVNVANVVANTASFPVANFSQNTTSIPALNSSTDATSVPAPTPSRDTVSVERALGNSGSPYRVFLSPGTGVSISVPDGEFIEKVWLDNPAEIVVDANGCLSGLPKVGECKGDATTLHLRSIERLNFPGVLVSDSSLLSIIAASSDGKRHIYLFEIIPSGQGKQTIFSIAIDRPQPVPAIAPQVEVRPIAIAAFAVERGAAIALSASLYPQNSPIWNRVRDFVSRLKGGQSVRAAAAASGVSLELLYKLQTLGVLPDSNI